MKREKQEEKNKKNTAVEPDCHPLHCGYPDMCGECALFCAFQKHPLKAQKLDKA